MPPPLEYSKDRDATYANDVYKLPNDAPEHLRLEQQARGIVSMIHGKTIHAPVEDPSRMLDIGCGTGITTAYLAEKFPAAAVFGVDLSPVPAIHSAPNLSWIQGNVRDLIGVHPELKAGSFDLVYSRLLIWGMTDWPGYVKAQADLVKPGGWVEIQDINMLLSDYNTLIDLDSFESMRELFSAAKDAGMDVKCGVNAKRYMHDAGLTNIHTLDFEWPFGTWMAKTNPETELIGTVWEQSMEPLVHMVMHRFLAPRIHGERLQRLLDEAGDLWSTVPGRSFKFSVTYGQKPDSPEHRT